MADAFFVTLGIDREVFAVPVETVVEILDMRPVFRIPDAPAHLAGLIDMRGRAVPLIDLRTKLGLPSVAADQNTRIVVLEVPMDGRSLALGLVADRVFEVIALDETQIESAPDIGMQLEFGLYPRHRPPTGQLRGVARSPEVVFGR